MITVRYDALSITMEQAQLVPWLFGFNEVMPGTLSMRTIEERGLDTFCDKNITVLTDTANEENERYSITVGDASTELPADWVISWTSGLAAHRGVDLLALIDAHVHERNRRMQALMICHQNRWLEYNGITEGNRP